MSIQLMGFGASIISEKDVVEKLEEAISEYKKNGELETLAPACMLVMMKLKTTEDGDLGKTFQDLKDAEKAKQIYESVNGS